MHGSDAGGDGDLYGGKKEASEMCHKLDMSTGRGAQA